VTVSDRLEASNREAIDASLTWIITISKKHHDCNPAATQSTIVGVVSYGIATT
jgi:hypothetical protein